MLILSSNSQWTVLDELVPHPLIVDRINNSPLLCNLSDFFLFCFPFLFCHPCLLPLNKIMHEQTPSGGCQRRGGIRWSHHGKRISTSVSLNQSPAPWWWVEGFPGASIFTDGFVTWNLNWKGSLQIHCVTLVWPCRRHRIGTSRKLTLSISFHNVAFSLELCIMYHAACFPTSMPRVIIKFSCPKLISSFICHTGII